MRALPAAFVSLGAVALVAIVPARPAARAAAGIHEEIPARDQIRYQAWKNEFLSADVGRTEWQSYAADPRLTITVTTSTSNPHGAGIGHYEWDSAGHLVAATITLGARLDEEYPEPVYYPVMNALKHDLFRHAIDRRTLAATKIAHEFGHLRRMTSMDASMYRLRMELVPSYNAIIRKNGWNDRDPRLLDMVQRMGGTPVELWEDSEYWGEVNAMLYLRDRINDRQLQCSLFSLIIDTVDTYAKGYRTRFAQIAESQAPHGRCGA